MNRLQKIEAAIMTTTDRRLLKLLNRAWGREWLRLQSEQLQSNGVAAVGATKSHAGNCGGIDLPHAETTRREHGNSASHAQAGRNSCAVTAPSEVAA